MNNVDNIDLIRIKAIIDIKEKIKKNPGCVLKAKYMVRNMNNENNIRIKAIIDIKEKIKKNPGYLYPYNKEILEDMKKLMFVSGNGSTPEKLDKLID